MTYWHDFDKIISILREYEYVNGFNAFIMKSLDNLNFGLPIDSQERIKITNLINNEIIVFEFDVEEVILLMF